MPGVTSRPMQPHRKCAVCSPRRASSKIFLSNKHMNTNNLVSSNTEKIQTLVSSRSASDEDLLLHYNRILALLFQCASTGDERLRSGVSRALTNPQTYLIYKLLAGHSLSVPLVNLEHPFSETGSEFSPGDSWDILSGGTNPTPVSSLPATPPPSPRDSSAASNPRCIIS